MHMLESHCVPGARGEHVSVQSQAAKTMSRSSPLLVA